MLPDKRSFLAFSCLYHLFAFFLISWVNGMAFSHTEYVAECQLTL